MMITTINSSILESTTTSDDDEMNTSASKPTHVETTIKQLTKETILSRKSELKLVVRVHNIRETISIIEIFTLKEISGCSIYNTIKMTERSNFCMDDFSYQSQSIMCFK